MTTVTLNGNPYSDAGEAARDMRNDGHRTWLLPMLSDTLAEVAVAQAAAAAAAGSAGTYDTSVTSNTIASSGDKTFTVSAGKAWVAGQWAVCADTAAPTTNYMYGQIKSYSGTTLVVTVSSSAGSGTFTAWTISINGKPGADGAGAVGKKTIWIPAVALVSRATNGPSAGSVETSTNKVMLRTFDFDTATAEYAQIAIQMPKSWDEGTITAKFVWSHAATTTNFGVAWAIQGVAISDTDAGDAAFGTAVSTADTGGTTNTIYISAESSAVTIAGTPAAMDWVVLQIYRDVSAGGDTMAIDARLHGIQLYYTTDAGTDV